MKSKLLIRLGLAFSLLLASLITAFSQRPPPPTPPPAVDPATGLPQTSQPPQYKDPWGAPYVITTQANSTPQPAQPFQWKDTDWKEPVTILPDVDYPGNIVVTSLANRLRESFSNEFDILLPQAFVRGNRSAESAGFQLKLKNATASEVFKAMNMLFEINHKQLRWELRMNGHRPVALLRILEENDPAKTIRKVVYIGGLLPPEGVPGMTADQFVETLDKVYDADFHDMPIGLRFHPEAQLLIITGTPEQVSFIEQVLEGLNQKVEHDRSSGLMIQHPPATKKFGGERPAEPVQPAPPRKPGTTN